MPTFAYKARSGTGELVQGKIVADNSTAAARMLGERQLLPVDIQQHRTDEKSFLTGRSRRVKLSAVGMMYEQLADLLRAGVPMLRSLTVLGKQAASPALVHVLREVYEDVQGGDALADAMEKHPYAFPPLHASMVRAGEKGGFLEDVLTRLSEFVTRQDALRNKFIGAMIYPTMLLLGGIGAVAVIMLVIVPKIRTLLEEQNLPWPTRVVFGLNDLLTNHYLEVLGIIMVVVISIAAFFQSKLGKQAMSHVQLRAPLFGKIYTMVSLCRFCRIFGTLLANGIQILPSLKIAKDSAGNPLLAKAIEDAAENVRSGEPLAEPLAQSKLFPPVILDMIAVAEESNTLEKVLIEVADTQDERTARQIDLMMRLLEPMMLLLIAAMVLFIAVSLLLPILQISTSGLS